MTTFHEMSRNSPLKSTNGFLLIISLLINALKRFSILQAKCHKRQSCIIVTSYQQKSRKFANVRLSNLPDAFQNNDVKLKR